ncbi:MAG: hypothetical protein HZA61_05400 [Candidatus Eisenbacteria bacterium]|uniref:Uncharacterized protein n=1 Tax=Eiseniibacteriota bacterium TaxID=2212470 RepID=A0A933WA15_UNCEI|nr:hypothetical protein [Candidatus Eisenbacteria bacterium]
MQSTWIHRVISRFGPLFVPGRTLHRRALLLAAAGDAVGAEAAFAAAAASYRRTWNVGALARLRVHERMVQARLAGDPAREAEMLLGIVRGLNKLDQLESLEEPFELRDARAVLSDWLADTRSGAPELHEHAA